MRQLRYAYSGLKYHKKLSIVISLIFISSVLLLTSISCLIYTETENLVQLRNKWSIVESILPNVNKSFFHKMSETSQLVINHYIALRTLLLLVLVIIFSLLIGYCLHVRKNEIKSLHTLGARKISAVSQLTLEFLLSFFFSFLIIVVLLILFQGNFSQTILSANTNDFNAAFPSQTTLTISKQNQDADETQTSSEVEMIPFNRESMFDLRSEQQLDLMTILQLTCQNSLVLLAIFITTLILLTSVYSLYIFSH